MLNSLTIKIAATDSEREAAYRLRYDVFDLEEGDHRYSDHNRKFWIDQDDGPNSTVLIALDQEGCCIGTTRFTLLRDQTFIGLEAYHLEVLAPLLCLTLEQLCEIVGRWDRGVVTRSARGLGLLQLMEVQVAGYAFRHGCKVLVATVKPDNRAVLSAVEKSGYHTYPAIGSYGGFTGQLIYKDLRTKFSTPDESIL